MSERRFTTWRRGARVLFSRRFWQAFREYWSPSEVAKRLDEFTRRLNGPR